MTTMGQYTEDLQLLSQQSTTRLARVEFRRESSRSSTGHERALRPKPLNVASKQSSSNANSASRTASHSQKENVNSYAKAQSQGSYDSPTISCTASFSAVPQQDRDNKTSPSPRQSEISIGILDYYMRGPSPGIVSPVLPPPPTPKLDPAIERFDFGLQATPTPCTNFPSTEQKAIMLPRTRPRAATKTQADQPLIPISPPSRPSATLTRGYTLFPVIRDVTPPRRQPQIPALHSETLPLTLRDRSSPPTSLASSVNSPPETTYRPRKESISSSIRTRNDSIYSFQARLANRQRKPSVPLRILPSVNTSSPPSSNANNSARSSRRTTTSSSSTAAYTSPTSIYSSSEKYKSRWSDETATTGTTITSPSFAPTPEPRNSFGSLLRRGSICGGNGSGSGGVQYPACFFEDDDDGLDEAAPLRRKLVWKKGSSIGGGRGRFVLGGDGKGIREIEEDERERKGRGGWWRGWLCGCAGR